MKRLVKLISVFCMTFVFLLSMASCTGYDFYSDWHNAGASIEKEHIFEVITLEEATKMKKDGISFALLYASSSSQESVKVVSTLQAQAEYLGREDAVIYFLDAKDYDTSSKRKELRSADTIYMHEAPTDGSPIIMTFKSTAVDVDTSFTNKPKTKQFFVNGSFQYASLASYIFKDLLKK